MTSMFTRGIRFEVVQDVAPGSSKVMSFRLEIRPMPDEKLLTFELSELCDEIDIHANRKGLEDFIYYMQRLLNSGKPLPRHDHLMTQNWGGYELTGEKQDQKSTLIHKVNVRLWE